MKTKMGRPSGLPRSASQTAPCFSRPTATINARANILCSATYIAHAYKHSIKLNSPEVRNVLRENFPLLKKYIITIKVIFGESNILRTVFLSAAFAVFANNALAQPIDTYKARLSKQDHYNSSGEELISAAAIIRQDRANFYVFGKIDPEDEHDNFFNNKANRARLEKMLSRGSISDSDAESIMKGTPLIRIDIHADHVVVTVEEQ